MCVEILMPDGETLVTIRDAVKALPVIISRQRVYNGDLDTCLCWLDIDETARANGYGVIWPEHRMWAGFARPVIQRKNGSWTEPGGPPLFPPETEECGEL